MKFLVTGCSRSGTAYAATLLSAAGIRTRHERVFNISRLDRRVPATSLPFWDDHEGESSFLAVPFLAELPAGSAVLHQVRDPIEVVRSHAGLRFFAEPYTPSVYLAFNHPEIIRLIGETCPGVFEDDDEIKRCMRYWTMWNRTIEEGARSRHRYFRYRVEDVGPELLQEIVAFLREDVPRDRLDAALAYASPSTNSRPRDESIDWSRLPKGEGRAREARARVRLRHRVDDSEPRAKLRQ